MAKARRRASCTFNRKGLRNRTQTIETVIWLSESRLRVTTLVQTATVVRNGILREEGGNRIIVGDFLVAIKIGRTTGQIAVTDQTVPLLVEMYHI